MKEFSETYRKPKDLKSRRNGFCIILFLIPTLFFLALSVVWASNGTEGDPHIPRASLPENDSVYRAPKLKGPIHLDGKWNKQPWKSVKPLRLTHYMGQIPAFQPKVQAKMMYDDTNLYIIFKVKDRYIKSTIQEFNGPVSRDACVEFFFSPNQKVPNGYFNIEINAGGTPLAGYHIFKQQTGGLFSHEDLRRIEIFHSLPRLIEKEITKPTTWTVEYKIPFSVLKKYAALQVPQPGDIWKANFYKIASEGSNPHYLTWSFVDYFKPSFHQPQFFGTIVFTE